MYDTNEEVFTNIANPYRRYSRHLSNSLNFRYIPIDYSIKKNKSVNIFKMNILNNRIKQLEEDINRDQLRINKLIEDNYLFMQRNNKNNFNKFYINSNYYLNNPESLNQEMNNIRYPIPFLNYEKLSYDQLLKMEQIQYDIDKTRQKIHFNQKSMIYPYIMNNQI